MPEDAPPPWDAVPALDVVEVGGPPGGPPGGLPVRGNARAGAIRVAAWNLERCLYPDESARILSRSGADLTLLTEMDIGMLRSGQVHTIGRVAASLGQRYAYGLEFLELDLMPPPSGFAAVGSVDTEGFHGNGFVSALPFENPVIIRLDPVMDWFQHLPAGQRRKLGARMGIAATFRAGDARFVACSVHLEYRCDGAGRALQMRTLLDALDAYADGLPVIVGGDLNTPTPAGRTDYPAEPLFGQAAGRGYDWAACNAGRPTTRASIWTPGKGDHQLDWFCTRGMTARDPLVIPAVGEDGDILSDHELISVLIEVR
jgi:endonuclease/exonuclease/phosphatase family metal-dependent hydrolase